MKQKFYLFTVLLAMATAASAQIQMEGKETNEWPRMLPKEFSYDNTPYIVTKSDENFGQPDAKCVLTIYNDDIEKVRSFEVPNYAGSVRFEYYQRKNIPIVNRQYEIGDWGPFSNKEEAIEWVKLNISPDDGVNVDGDNIYSLESRNYYEYETLGYTYPHECWKWNSGDNQLHLIVTDYQNSYTGDWELIEERSESYNYSDEILVELGYSDFNSNVDYIEIYLTQTLFNTDDKYEYIRANYEETLETYSEDDRDWDGEIDYKVVRSYYQMKSFSIVQEDGTILQTIPGAYGPELIQINDKRYLAVENREKNADGDYVYTHTYYLIDSKSNQIKRMDIEMPMSVRPSVTDRNGQVTVELGEQSDAKEIWVVNGAGQTVKRIPVEKGQKQVVFSANGLNKGVNVVHASGRNAQASRKIVVK